MFPSRKSNRAMRAPARERSTSSVAAARALVPPLTIDGVTTVAARSSASPVIEARVVPSARGSSRRTDHGARARSAAPTAPSRTAMFPWPVSNRAKVTTPVMTAPATTATHRPIRPGPPRVSHQPHRIAAAG